MNKTITRIRKCKDKVVIYFNSEKMELSFSTYSSFYLYKGKELNENEYNKIYTINQVTSLKNYALSLRSKNNYSEWKLREKLYAKEGNKEQVDIIINDLKKTGIINDEQYAQELYEYLNSKNYGKNKIVSYLKEKGIFDQTINKLKFDDKEELKKAKKLLPILIKKYSKYNYNQKKSHIYNALISKGFDNDIINIVICEIKNDNPKEELEKLKKDYQKAKLKLSNKYKGKELSDKIISSLLMKGYKYQDIMKVRK